MMTNDELINTLKTASETQENIALKMLLLMAAERIQQERDLNGLLLVVEEAIQNGNCPWTIEQAFEEIR
jgi:hypothetical protein